MKKPRMQNLYYSNGLTQYSHTHCDVYAHKGSPFKPPQKIFPPYKMVVVGQVTEKDNRNTFYGFIGIIVTTIQSYSVIDS